MNDGMLVMYNRMCVDNCYIEMHEQILRYVVRNLWHVCVCSSNKTNDNEQV